MTPGLFFGITAALGLLSQMTSTAERCQPRQTPLTGIEMALRDGRSGLAHQMAIELAHGHPRRDVAFRILSRIFFRWGYAREALSFARSAATFSGEASILASAFLEAGLPRAALSSSPNLDTKVRALRALGEVNQAKEVASQALLASPSDMAAHLALARAVADEDPRRAEEHLQQARSIDPQDPRVIVAAAQLMGSGQAESDLRLLATTGRGSVEAYFRLAAMYADAANSDEAAFWSCEARNLEIDQLFPHDARARRWESRPVFHNHSATSE